MLFFKVKREKLRLLLAGILSLALVYGLCPDEVNTTLQMNRTVSQRQSTESRVDGTQAAWKAFKEKPLLGYGSRNFTYAVDHELNQDSRRTFTSFAPNVVTQLLVEKGMVGTLLYVGFAIFVVRAIWRKRRDSDARVVGCTLAAVCVKDMSQATLFNTFFTLWMTFVLLAFLFRKPYAENMPESAVRPRHYIVPGVAFVAVLMWNFPGWQKFADPTGNLVRQAYETMKGRMISGSLRTAETCLKQASVRHPEDLQISCLSARLAFYKGELARAEGILAPLAEKYPRNSLYVWSLGEVYYLEGNKEAALSACVKAVRNMPRLLTHVRMDEWRQNDVSFYQSLRDSLSVLKPKSGDTPADYARYGYIARWCGNSCAGEYLRAAVEGLPNLATPWHLLGDDRKYRLLLYGAFRRNLEGITLPEQISMTDAHLFEMAYMAKFQNWYGEKLVTDEF